MPTATRRQAQARHQRTSEPSIEFPSDEADHMEDGTLPDPHMAVEESEGEGEGEEGEEGDDGDEEIPDGEDELPFPPPGLKEISSLASWTVSTAKPGSGVAALRSPDTQQFWQSDGPQPHLLSIHFFKLVSIVHMRIYLDFAQDESYTPTKIQFSAGMAAHDMQDFAEMAFEQPQGWIDVDFSNVGPVEEDREEGEAGEVDWSKRPVLRAFLVHVRILENHQNGKDTHLRAVQLFARDEMHVGPRRAMKAEDSFFALAQVRSKVEAMGKVPRRSEANNIKIADWMMDPDLR